MDVGDMLIDTILRAIRAKVYFWRRLTDKTLYS